MSTKLPKLSPSALSLLKDCGRCFWLSKNRVAKPRGIFPSLPSGMDTIIKDSHDRYRLDGQKLPPIILRQLPEGATAFKDLILLNKWRQLGRGMSTTIKWGDHEVQLGGLVDDVIAFHCKHEKCASFKEEEGVKFGVDSGGRFTCRDGLVYSPYDYKTKKGPPPAPDYPKRYYGHQVDIYDLLLTDNGYPTNGDGYFSFYTTLDIDAPNEKNIARNVEPINFDVTVIHMDTSWERAKEFVIRACEVLMGPLPEPGDECEYCTYTKKRALKMQEIHKARKEAAAAAEAAEAAEAAKPAGATESAAA